MNESKVKLAAKMYECRDTLKGLWGDRYAAEIAPWVVFVKRECEAFDWPLLTLVPRLSQAGELSAIEILWLTAATVEAVEPSEAVA